MEHLLNDIIELIGNNMPDIRTVDEDYGQLEMLDDSRDSYPLIFPAVLIDAPETSWENIGGLSQRDSALSVSVSASTAMTTPTTTPVLQGRFSPGRKREESCTGSCKVIASAAVQLS